MTTTQTRAVREIQERIAIIQGVRHDMMNRLHSSGTNKIHASYLREKIKGLNTELRILENIRTSLYRTINEA